MKVVSADEMGRLEQLAFADGAKAEDFMEEAGKGIAAELLAWIVMRDVLHQVLLICGKGNNAGDAYVAGRYLIAQGFSVRAVQLGELEQSSPLAQKNAARFKERGGKIQLLQTAEELELPSTGVILDGLVGTGFKGRLEGLYAQTVEKITDSSLPVVAIDIPSGLNGSTGEALGSVLTADLTLFLGLPKTGFFVRSGWGHVGRLRHVDFGLDTRYLELANADLDLVLPSDVAPLRPPIIRSRHKYQAGYVLGLAGSPGMAGAAVLSASAALRGGAGVVKLLHPDGMQAELANSPVELIKLAYSTRDLDWIRETMGGATACYAGPGLARSPGMKVVVNTIVPQLHMPCVIDADGINIMAEEGLKPPRQTVLTPHLGEMRRLLNLDTSPEVDLEFIGSCVQFAEHNEITLVLKGGPTFILHPGELPVVCPRGNPGMATAGSGDVLTGLITALLSQGCSLRDAAVAGVYLHAVSGDLAAEALTSYCITASSLLDYLPMAFKQVFFPKAGLLEEV